MEGAAAIMLGVGVGVGFDAGLSFDAGTRLSDVRVSNSRTHTPLIVQSTILTLALSHTHPPLSVQSTICLGNSCDRSRYSAQRFGFGVSLERNHGLRPRAKS